MSVREKTKKSYKIKVRIETATIILAIRFEIDFFKFLRLFKVNFISKNFLEYKILTSIRYSKNPDNYSKYYIKNYEISKII